MLNYNYHLEKPLSELVCSTIKFVHDLSLDRRESDWFLSLNYTNSFSTKGIYHILVKCLKKGYFDKILYVLTILLLLIW